MTTYPLAGREMPLSIRASRRFRAPRSDGARYHAGIDVPAVTNDQILAPVAGETWEVPWSGLAKAIVVMGDSETWLLAPARLLVPGLVEEGTPIGRVTSYSPPNLATHLHVQLWDKPYKPPLPKSLTSWPVDAPRPAGLVDPTLRLRLASPGQRTAAAGVALAVGLVWLIARASRRRST